MILILISIIAAIVLAWVLFQYAGSNFGGSGTLAVVLAIILSIAAAISSIAYAIGGWAWFAAEHKAKIINREYGTNYTQADVFWASDVIDTIRQLDRKRIEINGDLMRDEKR